MIFVPLEAKFALPRGTYLVPTHAETNSEILLCLQVTDCFRDLVGAPGLEPGTR